ncbi:MAG: chemotaxis protein CheW [Nitrospirota bacterium]|nr:chemotaxis protein CheW [Nitrospirota bacterium]
MSDDLNPPTRKAGVRKSAPVGEALFGERDEVLFEQLRRLQADFEEGVARPVETGPTGLGRFLKARVGPENFALPILRVRRLVRNPEVMPLPGAPPHLLGMINLRGDLVTVYDLPALFGYPRSTLPVEELVVLAGPTFDAAVAVDATHGLVELDEGGMGKPPATLPSSVRALVRGTLPHGDVLFLFPDVDSLFVQLDARG